MTTLERASSDIVVGHWRHMLERHSEKRYGGVAQNLHLKCPDNLKPAYIPKSIYELNSDHDRRDRTWKCGRVFEDEILLTHARQILEESPLMTSDDHRQFSESS